MEDRCAKTLNGCYSPSAKASPNLKSVSLQIKLKLRIKSQVSAPTDARLSLITL